MSNRLMFKNMLRVSLTDIKTEPELEKVAEDLRAVPLFQNISDSEFEEILFDAKASLRVTFGKSYTIEENDRIKPWFREFYSSINHHTRWERYKEYLINTKHFDPKAISEMTDNLFKITNLLGNPKGNNFKRKGLVVGDVQSGKTANYVGLMNLASDAEYKVIIVLTGTTNTLREQTQIRIEEGLGIAGSQDGVTSNPSIEYQIFKSKDPVYLTSQTKDFSKTSKETFQASIEATTVPIVIVTKKNISALKNIKEWLDDYSKGKNNTHINSSLLLIDDEADFASVNTKKNLETEKPTQINRRIREILELFTKSSYIGFTATPYANIFIDPSDETSMYGQDLFPKDYIYVLGESGKYLGVEKVFSDEGEHKNMLVRLNEEEVETYLPLKHKKDQPFSELAPSMLTALNLFFLANVIRDLRGHINQHRSMLMNISRFQDMHEKIKLSVSEHVLKMQRDIRLNSKLPIEEALGNVTIASLKKSFDAHYSGLEEGFTFEEILNQMNKSVYNIHVAIVNANSKELNYLAKEERGEYERVIVVGGFALSRGLTLEGLMISYYYRNSVMYDSLLQMGRWFGFRNKYEDLCKIFMTESVISDFRFISLATKELKEDLAIHSERGSTPKEFGIRVRSGQAGLIVTSRNKMRTGKKITTRVDFNNDIIATRALKIDSQINNKNKKLVERLISENIDHLSDKMYPKNSKIIGYGLCGINRVKIIEFLKNYKSVNGSNFDSELIVRWLQTNNLKELEKWDVAFPFVTTDDTDGQPVDFGFGIKGLSRVLSVQKRDDDLYKINRSRLGNPSDGRYGLDQDQVEKVKTHFSYEGKSLSQKNYLWSDLKRKPLLLVYSITPKESKGNYLGSEPITLLSISIPDLGFGKSKVVDYTVNKIYQDLEEIEVEEE